MLVVYFHLFVTYIDGRPAPSWDWPTMSGSAGALAETVWLKLSGLGFHAVGLFIALSGGALMESTSRRAAKGPIKWGSWYVARLVRLYPMYWVAHLVYLLSPFVARLEPVDSRIVLSLLGFRFVDISRNFHYLNAAWWYFALLLQLVLMFPLLFWAARRLGPWKFLAVAAAVGFIARYLLLVVYQQSGVWSTGGLALCRLPEFALGMALGMWHAHAPEKAEKFFLGGAGLVAGILLYPLALAQDSVEHLWLDLCVGGEHGDHRRHVGTDHARALGDARDAHGVPAGTGNRPRRHLRLGVRRHDGAGERLERTSVGRMLEAAGHPRDLGRDALHRKLDADHARRVDEHALAGAADGDRHGVHHLLRVGHAARPRRSVGAA